MGRSLALLGAVAVLLLAGGALLFWKRPLAVMAFFGRRALASAGLTKRSVPASCGVQRVWSGGSGPVLVLVHGAGGQAANWAKVAPDLLKGRRLVIPDLPGHCESEPREGPLPIETLMAGLDAVIAAEAPEGKLTLAGNSLGAWRAAIWAERHPERVERRKYCPQCDKHLAHKESK
jgi:hypothetical protein